MIQRVFSLLAAALLAAGCADSGDDGDSGDPGDPSVCADRTGGALIAFEIRDESFTVWSTNETFIADAHGVRDGVSQLIPVFNQLVDGGDCDSQWSWHVDPEDMGWAEVTIEVCDSVPSLIEEDKSYWLDTVDQFCPWSARVDDIAEQ